jgi:hypothetical protein
VRLRREELQKTRRPAAEQAAADSAAAIALFERCGWDRAEFERGDWRAIDAKIDALQDRALALAAAEGKPGGAATAATDTHQ